MTFTHISFYDKLSTHFTLEITKMASCRDPIKIVILKKLSISMGDTKNCAYRVCLRNMFDVQIRFLNKLFDASDCMRCRSIMQSGHVYLIT